MSWTDFALRMLASAVGALIAKLILAKLKAPSFQRKVRPISDSVLVVGKLPAVNRLILLVPFIAVLLFVQSTSREGWLNLVQDQNANVPSTYNRETPSPSAKVRGKLNKTEISIDRGYASLIYNPSDPFIRPSNPPRPLLLMLHDTAHTVGSIPESKPIVPEAAPDPYLLAFSSATSLLKNAECDRVFQPVTSYPPPTGAQVYQDILRACR